MRRRPHIAIFLLSAICAIATRPAAAQAPSAQVPAASDSDPSATLTDVLSVACRGDQVKFANFFTADNAAAFRALPIDERKRLLQRFSLSDNPGRPLLSADQDNRPIVRCETPGGVTEFRFGAARVNDNLAFIPISVVNSQQAEIGMVRENGSWKLLSLGLVLLDIKQLSIQWSQADLNAREDAAVAALQTISSAIDTYKRIFGKYPDSLAQLGPAPKDQVSAELASLVSAPLAAGSNDGYRFHYRIAFGSRAQYQIEAVPEDYGTSGRDSFFRDPSGQIHVADKHGGSATAADPIWQDEKTQ
jgi:hypothetical protein